MGDEPGSYRYVLNVTTCVYKKDTVGDLGS